MASRVGKGLHDTTGKGMAINCEAISKLATESGKAISTIAESIEDKIITDDERADCTKALLSLQKTVSLLLVQLNK